MKKTLAAAAAVTAMSLMSISAFADNIYVTIADGNGKLAVAQQKIDVTDTDGDGILTVNDALSTAHDKFYDGGSEAGYASDTGDYGLFVTKLWGVENGGSYGYYINNTSAMSLTDPVKEGDIINAYVFTDTTGFTDTYCYFNTNVTDFTDADPSQSLTAELVLNAAAFDENWMPVTLPVKGAVITINGEKTDYVTDDSGFVMVDIPSADGRYVISAVSDTQNLVPPVCVANVSLLSNDSAVSSGDVDAAADSSKGSPDTGIADIAAVAGIAVIAAGAICVSKKRK